MVQVVDCGEVGGDSRERRRMFLVQWMGRLWGSGESGGRMGGEAPGFLLVRVCTAEFSKLGTGVSGWVGGVWARFPHFLRAYYCY